MGRRPNMARRCWPCTRLRASFSGWESGQPARRRKWPRARARYGQAAARPRLSAGSKACWARAFGAVKGLMFRSDRLHALVWCRRPARPDCDAPRAWMTDSRTLSGGSTAVERVRCAKDTPSSRGELLRPEATNASKDGVHNDVRIGPANELLLYNLDMLVDSRPRRGRLSGRLPDAQQHASNCASPTLRQPHHPRSLDVLDGDGRDRRVGLDAEAPRAGAGGRRRSSRAMRLGEGSHGISRPARAAGGLVWPATVEPAPTGRG